MSETITAGHVQRKAIVYVRQSTQQQVVHNQESRRLQYRMVDRMVSLGWKKPDVEVIDDDLGVSASGSMERVGFQRMVAEVCLGRVGAVAARELSRFARNSSDWQQLIEMCGFVGALLVDEGTVYDPHRADDRLMLGVKGSMSEYELHLIKDRSLKARNAKAARGELVANVPAGYIKTRGQRFEMDPDQRVQESIRMVFSKILELGSARQVSLWLIEEDLQLPAWRHGVLGWETLWKRPTYQQVRKILRNPAYAGAYAFGRTREARMLESDGTVRLSRLRKPREEWSVLIQDHHPGYVSWETYERIQTMLVQNRTGFTRMGAARKGEALLVGLLRCRRCGRNLGVDYTTRSGGHVYRYGCRGIDVGPGEPRCLSLGGPATDRAVSAEVLRVIQPAAVEVALAAASEENADRGKLTQALLLELEAARYEAARAQKQYDLVDPENRLVARSLEDRWNEALALVERLERRVGEARREQSSLPALELSRLMELARDVEELWDAPETDVRKKKRILRALIEGIVVEVHEQKGEIEAVIHWKGGVHTELRIRRRRSGQTRFATPPDVSAAVVRLARICTDEMIAALLTRNGLRTGKGNRWTSRRVRALRYRQGAPLHSRARQEEEGWLNLTDGARYLGVSTITLRRAVENGELAADHPLADGPWVFNRKTLDSDAAKKIAERSSARGKRGSNTQSPAANPSLFKNFAR